MNAAIHQATAVADKLTDEVGQVILGKDDEIRLALACVLAGGHLLIEDVPGVGKTLLARSLAVVLDLSFSRIQFTSDLMPADVIGVTIYQQTEARFQFHKGPLFAQLILADEINRATPKSQSALLEAMEERQITVANTTHKLPPLFMVMATQNPIEQEGTYPLPEAQVDRFMLKVKVGYPSKEEERRIIDRMSGAHPEPEVKQVATAEQVRAARRTVDQIFVDDKVKSYVVDLVHATRDPVAAGITDLDGMLEMGASPRASICLTKAAKAHAFLQGRGYATPHDVKGVAPDVLRHRVVLTYEAEAEGRSTDDVIERILVGVLVP